MDAFAPPPVITQDMIDMAQRMERELGLPPGLSLLGVVAAAYLAGWKTALRAGETDDRDAA